MLFQQHLLRGHPFTVVAEQKLDELVKKYDDSPTNRDKKVFFDELNQFFASAL